LDKNPYRITSEHIVNPHKTHFCCQNDENFLYLNKTYVHYAWLTGFKIIATSYTWKFSENFWHLFISFWHKSTQHSKVFATKSKIPSTWIEFMIYGLMLWKLNWFPWKFYESQITIGYIVHIIFHLFSFYIKIQNIP